MTAPNLSYSLEYWQQVHPKDQNTSNMANNVQGYEQAEQNPRALGFPIVLQGEPDPWALENYDWSGEMALKSSSDFVQNWQLCDGPYAANLDEERNLNMAGSWMPDYQTPISPFPHPDKTEKQHMLSRVAAERALFMTPSVHALSVSTFPGSPVSDHSSTPENTQAPYSRYEDRGASPLSDTMSESSSAMHGPLATGWLPDCPAWKTDDEVCPTMLEMPDGSSRKTSNWLPVDPEAGFTIGSCSFPDGPDFHFEGLHDIREAFIPSGSSQWTYTG
ncbi:hypothetical protein N7494_006903 [Penicillium frequentans]|uniref:Uncharacterized protein n=1 Tax=Penicillium frequentans TaxID=3151616 RepID=A0AAD6CXA9_9EURO|nr:hypothetical protein N7494_006903 [Penicillium glabrum]